MLIAVSSLSLALIRTASASPHQLAQVTPNTVTDRLDAGDNTLYDGSYFQAYSFEGSEGEHVTIAVSSNDFDAYLMLLGPQGDFIDHSDNTEGIGSLQLPNGTSLPQADPSRDSTDAFLIITLPSTGTYQVTANTRNAGETGEYTVSWRQSTAADLEKSPPNVIPMGEFDAGFEADALEVQISNLLEAARYEEAISLAEKQLEIYFEYRGKYSSVVQLMLNRLALIHVELQRFDDAEVLYKQALAIPDDAHESDSLNGLASLYRTQGRNDEASALLNQAGNTYTTSLDDFWNPSSQQHANDLDLALLFRFQGRYDDAEALLMEALDNTFIGSGYVDNLSLSEVLARFDIDLLEMLEARDTSDIDVAVILSQLAVLDYLRGSDNRAERLFKEAIDIFKDPVNFDIGIDEIETLAVTYSDLGLLYNSQDRYSEAKPLFIQSLQILEELEFGYYSTDTIAVLQELDWGNQSFSFATNVAIVFSRIADLYYSQGNYAEAELIYRKLLEFYQQQFGDRHPYVAVNFVDLAQLYQSQNKTQQALQNLQQGLDIEDYHLDINLSSLTQAQGQAYVSNTITTTNQAISLNLEQIPGNQTAKQVALTTILRRKGRILDIASSSLQVLQQNLTSENQHLLDELVAVQAQLAALLFNPPTELLPEQYHAEIAQLETKASTLEADLVRRSASFRARTETAEVSQIRTQISEGGALIEYARYQPFDARSGTFSEPRYAAYLLFPDGRIDAIDLGDAAAIDTAVQAFTTLLQDPRADLRGNDATIITEIDPDRIETVTSTLKARVFDPIAPYLQGRQHLLISPDSQLNRLPFEALPTDDGRYLVEQYQISYLNSGRDLLKFDVVEPSTQPAVIVANPDYETASDSPRPDLGEGLGERASQPASDTADTRADRRSTDLRQLQFGPLPGTATEVAAIQPLLPNATVLTEGAATENVLKTVQAPRILHIATHGFFLDNADRIVSPAQVEEGVLSATAATTGVPIENPLLRSGLALAGFNPRESGAEDGVFTALEASNLNLFGTQLVVLSACDTGLGDIANGEGVYGLRRAFALAGAESQLMSLWQVSDQGTQSLMARYYDKLMAGMGRSEALRAVQLEMIRAGGRYSRPYYWAAFILAGDWRPLE